MKIQIIMALFFAMAGVAQAAVLPEAVLEDARKQESCILDYVVANRYMKRNASLPMPEIVYGHEISVEEFNRRLADMLGDFRYSAVSNVYYSSENTIFLSDTEASYPEKSGRTIYDSLAHELTHYVQYAYRHYSNEEAASDGAEEEAVYVQNDFREAFSKGGLCRN